MLLGARLASRLPPQVGGVPLLVGDEGVEAVREALGVLLDGWLWGWSEDQGMPVGTVNEATGQCCGGKIVQLATEWTSRVFSTEVKGWDTMVFAGFFFPRMLLKGVDKARDLGLSEFQTRPELS